MVLDAEAFKRHHFEVLLEVPSRDPGAQAPGVTWPSDEELLRNVELVKFTVLPHRGPRHGGGEASLTNLHRERQWRQVSCAGRSGICVGRDSCPSAAAANQPIHRSTNSPSSVNTTGITGHAT